MAAERVALRPDLASKLCNSHPILPELLKWFFQWKLFFFFPFLTETFLLKMGQRPKYKPVDLQSPRSFHFTSLPAKPRIHSCLSECSGKTWFSCLKSPSALVAVEWGHFSLNHSSFEIFPPADPWWLFSKKKKGQMFIKHWLCVRLFPV